MVAQFRSMVAQALQAGGDVATNIVQHSQRLPQDWIKAQLDDMVDEGLISGAT